MSEPAPRSCTAGTKPPGRRLFFALWPYDAVRHALLHWQTRNLPSDVRWQHRADLHLTLHFLGDDGKAPPGFAGRGRLHRGVDRGLPRVE